MKQLHDHMLQWEKDQDDRERKRRDRERKQGGVDAAKHQVGKSGSAVCSREVASIAVADVEWYRNNTVRCLRSLQTRRGEQPNK